MSTHRKTHPHAVTRVYLYLPLAHPHAVTHSCALTEAHTHAHTRLHTCTPAYTHGHTSTPAHAHPHMHTHTRCHTNTLTPSRAHSQSRMHSHTRRHTCPHTHRHSAHTCRPTCAHTVSREHAHTKARPARAGWSRGPGRDAKTPDDNANCLLRTEPPSLTEPRADAFSSVCKVSRIPLEGGRGLGWPRRGGRR